MTTVLNKLRFVRDYCLNKDIQTRVAFVIGKIADSTPPEDVSNDQDESTNEVATPLSLLEDNSDEFLVLMRTLPDDHELKKSIRILDLVVNKVKNTLNDISSQLKEVLSGNKEDIPVGDLSTFADLLQSSSDEFASSLELAAIMNSRAQKSKEEEKHKPVEHKLEKIKLGPKKKEEDEEIETDVGKSEEDKNEKVNKTVKKLDELIKSK